MPHFGLGRLLHPQAGSQDLLRERIGLLHEEHGRHAFTIPVPYSTLSDKAKRTVNFVTRKILGLGYQPVEAEHF